MSLITELFGKSPFGPLVEHTKKVHECVEAIRPLAEALLREDYEEIHRLQDRVSRTEYEADQIKHEIREHLPRRYFLPVNRDELDNFLRCQDRIADGVQDFAVVLHIRKTRMHESLKAPFLAFVDQIINVSMTLLKAALELQTLAEASFGGAEAQSVLEMIRGLGEEEWKADRMQRKLAMQIYGLEKELDPLTIVFYDKILEVLGRIANDAENTGDLLRLMIVKG